DRHAQGTGFIVSTDGYIVTNNHVIDGADELLVRLADDREFPATIVGTDSDTDLAVIHIEADRLIALPLGNSNDLNVGEWVIAIGSPFGLDQTVTAGIVSAKGRSGMGLATFENYIQTDAAINPGNSGGPLVNLYGELVGVNTAISSRSGGYDGIGFAIPSNMVQTVMNSIIETGTVVRGWLGVGIQPLTRELAGTFNLDHVRGVLVNEVIEDGPSAQAGLKEDDIIIGVDGNTITEPRELINAIAMNAPGSRHTLELLRDGDTKILNVTLGKRPGTGSTKDVQLDHALEPTNLGFRVETLNEQNAQQLGIDQTQGIVVTDVQPGSAAHRAGLAPGDLILSVNGNAINQSEALWNTLGDLDLAKGARLKIQRQGRKQYLVLKHTD
ncbi:MAG: trypsin-like peptidase domain-containing protein, partial [Planctomycetota bacterium]|nr:trypsin-like peptidase domain-containing protein [Planctomycetota bacterium]